MAVIVVQVGTEEKEISGLTRRTTCAEVLEALFKDEQTFHSLSQFQESTGNKNLRDTLKNYVIMEDWRGCEKALSAQTRILAVWKAWGDEQCNVRFSLKRNKDLGFNQGEVEKRTCDCGKTQIQQSPPGCVSTEFLSKLSHEQKKRIRRNMVQYQQAILSQQSRILTDNNNNAGVQSKYVQNKRNSKLLATQPPICDPAKIKLSEEQFVDGVIGFTEMHNEFPRNNLEAKFYREHCNYRRPHHRHHLPDGLGFYPDYQAKTPLPNFRSKIQNSKRSKSKRKSSSERKASKDDRRASRNATHRRTSQSSQNSSDSTTSVNVPNTIAELESRMRFSGDDADDEKSILTEYGSLLSRQKLAARSEQLHPSIDRLGNANLSTSAVTVADSSTTTSSDASNTSSSSLGTTSSDTSASSAEIYNESFFAKRAAAMAAAKATAAEKSRSGGPLKLFKIAKPSFMKKKKTPQSASSKSSQQSLPTDIKSNVGQPDNTAIKQNDQTGTCDYATDEQSASATISTSTEQHLHPKQTLPDEQASISIEVKSNNSTDESEIRRSEQLQRQILSQEQQLLEECKQLHFTNHEIEQLEAQINKLRAQTHGKNYVQDAYLSGFDDHQAKPQKIDKKPSRLSSVSEPVQWICECDNASALEEYLQVSERVISTQMNIEENKRQAEIILQEVQDEIWRLSNDPQMSPQTKRVTALALGLEPPELEAETSDEEEMTTNYTSLSVSSGKHKAVSSTKRLSRRKSNSELDDLEIKRTRMELEANLSLSLRLASEVDEVEKLMCNSRHLLQSKGENMLDMVRELAQSPEGISADLWDEFGELLMAFDAEMALKRYLAGTADCDNANSMQVEKAINREITQPQTVFSNEGVIDPTSPADNRLHHDLSPKTWTEQQNHDLKHSQSDNRISSKSNHPHFTDSSPLPKNRSRGRPSSLTSPLLPMPPVPDFNESDNEEILSKVSCKRNPVSPTMISTEEAVPVVVLRHNTSCPANLLSLANSMQERKRFSSSRDSTSTIDDSGNASGGSTNSVCASTDSGSRNGSCDGGSRPSSAIIESQDSAYSSPLFLRDNLKPNDNQLRFTYPPHLSPSTDKEKLPKLGHSQKRTAPKPPVPVKSPAVKLVSTALAAENKRRSLILYSENCQKNLIRRNSAQTLSSTKQDQFFRRVSSFGKSGISANDLPKQRQNPPKPLIRSKEQCALTQQKEAAVHQSKTKTRCHKNKPNPRQGLNPNAGLKGRDILHKVSISSADRSYKLSRSHGSTSTYENDSDTGLSSLHSTDSFDRLNITSGETLV